MQSPRYYSKRAPAADGPTYTEVANSVEGSRSVGRKEVAARTRAALNNGVADPQVVHKETARDSYAAGSRSYAARAQERPGLAVDTSIGQSNQTAPSSGGSYDKSDVNGYDDDYGDQFDGGRKDSVPERSPLQKLEVTLGDISKEEKRSRVLEAEELSRQRSAARKPRRGSIPKEPISKKTQPQVNDGRRVVSDGQEVRQGSSAPYGTSSGASYRSPRRNVTAAGNSAFDASRGLSYGQGRALGRYDSINTQMRRNGHNAALTGPAAAAAVGAFQSTYRSRYDPMDLKDDSSTSSSDEHQHQKENNYAQVQETKNLGNGVASQPRNDAQRNNVPVPGNTGNQNVGVNKILSRDPKPTSATAGPVTMRHVGNGMAAPVHRPQQTLELPAETTNARSVDHSTPRQLDQAAEPMQSEHSMGQGEERSTALPQQYHQRSEGLDEWKHGRTAVLSADIMNSDSTQDQHQPWWERNGADQRGGRSSDPKALHAGSQAQDRSLETVFQPPLTLKCGPLLRYTGLRGGSRASESHEPQSFWRGSIMIVTDDTTSSPRAPPTLRLFKQQMSLLPTPKVDANGQAAQQLSPETLDPVAGQIKCSTHGETLLAKPVHALQAGIDHSQTDQGLFQPANSTSDSQRAFSRIQSPDGEQLGQFAEVSAHRLGVERNHTFWRFNIEVELTAEQTRVAYRINRGPAIGFWVPAQDQSMNIMFHSCNGFSMSVKPDDFSGPDPLWRDVLAKHQNQPYHVMLGGGDQIYNDRAQRETTHFQEWLGTKNPEHKHKAAFTSNMQYELETFYFDNYAKWFSRGMFSVANAQIPMINIWDDHDIIDGFGSYPDHFMRSAVFSGLGAVAFKYYMLFQHQSVPEETPKTEPSWLLGTQPGPYIHEVSRSVFAWLGKGIAFVGLDCRTERTREEVLSQETYDMVFDRLRQEVVKGETKHLIVLLGIPIAYPRLNFLENVLTSKAMEPVKAISRLGLAKGFVNKFDGGVEVLDDLNDHWTAKHHKHERNWFIQELQEFAAENSIRITLLGGDVHVAAIGQFYSKKKLGIPKDHDHRYIPNVISSAIVNTPPPTMLTDLMKRRDKIHHLDLETDESMIPMFEYDVHGEMRYNNILMARRNWCSIKPYDGSLTPPPSPPPVDESRPPSRRRSFSFGRSSSTDQERPASLNNEGRPKGKLLKRLSSRKAPPSAFRGPSRERQQSNSPYADNDGLDPRVDGPIDRRWNSADAVNTRDSTEQSVRPAFQRRPSNFDDRLSSKDRSGRQGNINLEGGLEIALNIEADCKAPAGRTVPYRLIVPALFYTGGHDYNNEDLKAKTGMFSGLIRRFSSRKKSVTKGTPYTSNQSLGTPEQRATSHDDDVASGEDLDNLQNSSKYANNQRNRRTTNGVYGQSTDWENLQTLPRASGNVQADVPYQGSPEQTRTSLDRDRSLKRFPAASNERQQEPALPGRTNYREGPQQTQAQYQQQNQQYISGIAPPPRKGLDLPLGPVNNRFDKYDAAAYRQQQQQSQAQQQHRNVVSDASLASADESHPAAPAQRSKSAKDPYAHLYGDDLNSLSSIDSMTQNLPQHSSTNNATHLQPASSGKPSSRPGTGGNNNTKQNYPSPLASHTTTSVPGAPPSPLVQKPQPRASTGRDPYAHYTTSPVQSTSSPSLADENENENPNDTAASPTTPPPRNPNRASSTKLYGSSSSFIPQNPSVRPHQQVQSPLSHRHSGARPISMGMSSKAARQLGVDPAAADGKGGINTMYGQPIGWQGTDPMLVRQGPDVSRFGSRKEGRLGRMARRLSGSGGQEGAVGERERERQKERGGRSSWKMWK
ncbi:MAG: hypothetical protein M1828_005286 [Chrysothrix sp. TS-e1954]|nr:MAG: hypothetical protein M1828_005286 [Chrysothrix sp. TS-e1954]